MFCVQCSGRCIGPAIATQRRTVMCKRLNGSDTSTACDPRERFLFGLSSILTNHYHTHSHTYSVLHWITYTLWLTFLSSDQPWWGTAHQKCAMFTGGCLHGGCALLPVEVVFSLAGLSVYIIITTRPFLTSTAPGSVVLSPGNTATSLPVAVCTHSNSIWTPTDHFFRNSCTQPHSCTYPIGQLESEVIVGTESQIGSWISEKIHMIPCSKSGDHIYLASIATTKRYTLPGLQFNYVFCPCLTSCFNFSLWVCDFIFVHVPFLYKTNKYTLQWNNFHNS